MMFLCCRRSHPAKCMLQPWTGSSTCHGLLQPGLTSPSRASLLAETAVLQAARTVHVTRAPFTVQLQVRAPAARCCGTLQHLQARNCGMYLCHYTNICHSTSTTDALLCHSCCIPCALSAPSCCGCAKIQVSPASCVSHMRSGTIHCQDAARISKACMPGHK